MSGYTVLTSQRVFLNNPKDPDGLSPATIVISKSTGKIVYIVEEYDYDLPEQYSPRDVHDVGDKVILPGLVDAHVHLNEPGRTSWEGFYTGTRAALSGGITTLIDMPLNSIPPTTTVANLQEKRKAADGQCFCDVGFWGGVIPRNQSHLKSLVSAGVKGFKCFLIESGVEEFPCVTEDDLNEAGKVLDGLPTKLLFHAELSVDGSDSSCGTGVPSHYNTFLTSRPDQLELSAISMIIDRFLAKFPHLQCHIVHLSSAAALPLIRKYVLEQEECHLTVETCFHYLCLNAADIPDGKPEFKCCPPIRDDANRDALWKGLEEGLIDFVVSDHSPCTSDLKYPADLTQDADLMTAWGGISTLGLGFSLLYTEAQKRGIRLPSLISWTAIKTAEHAGLAKRKGRIAVGYDADFGVWDLEATFEVTKESLQFKNKLSPYVGLTLQGVVMKTYLRGEIVYERSSGFVRKPTGIFV